jgi:hypothetical protein
VGPDQGPRRLHRWSAHVAWRSAGRQVNGQVLPMCGQRPVTGESTSQVAGALIMIIVIVPTCATNCKLHTSQGGIFITDQV